MRQRARQSLASPTLRTITGLAGGNTLAMAVGIVGSLVQARFITPEELGYFRSFAIVTGYVFFLQLGLFGALARFYPYYIGKGQRERGLVVAEICQAWIVMVTVLVGGVYLVLALRALVIGDWPAGLAWLVQVVAIAGFFYGGYLGATYRSGHDFNTVSRGAVLASVVSLVTLPIFLIMPYIALVLRSSAGSLANLVFLHRRRPLRLPWRFNFREWHALVKVSLPMFTADYAANTGWAVVETTLILHFLGTDALGLWSMSFMLLEAANKVAQAITAVYIPRIIETFGRTERVRAGLVLCRKPLLLGTPAMLLMAGVGALLLPLIVPILMPNYAAAIPAMILMLLTLPLIVLDLPYSLLVAMGKITQQNLVAVVGLGSFVILTLIAMRLNLGLTAIVGASLFGRGIRLATIYGLLFRASRHEASFELIQSN
ncbi:hypothetical protein ANRL4_03431 [Anaerolineae bacterium]|nr:hypothetical protein ANRL4_03431 [Anaerolineae bacterium]